MSVDISQDAVEQFSEQGYAFFPSFFDDSEVERFREEANRVLELVVNSSLAHDRKNRRLNLVENAEGQQAIRQVSPSIDLTKTFHDLAINELADLIRPFIEEEPILIERTAQLNYKMPLPEPIEELDPDPSDDSYPVHNDWAYYEGWLPRGIITTAVFLDDCEEDSGPLQVWPGTHTEHIEHEESELGLQAPEEDIDHDAGEPVLGPKGSVLLFHSELVHSSEPNRSGRPRRLAIYGHAPESRVDTEIADGSARPETGSTYPPELQETKYEWEYQRLKDRGEFRDRFEAPTWE